MRLRQTIRVCFQLLLLLVSAKCWASTSLINEDLPWQVYETEHFRVHFTPELKDWALAASAEMEAFQAQIENKLQLTLDEKIQAVVIDPYNVANGFALPASYHPVMALFTTPPQSDQLANNPGWHQFLSVHEYIHLVHLSQKSRNRWRDLLARWVNLYDLTTPMVPQWVAEGYATLMESKLTGRGRLFDHYQEAKLQQLVYQGRFPRYSEMEGRLAYSLGSRFMFWLENLYGEEKLSQVWTRLYGVKGRSFDEAFEGIYLKPAEILYQQFAIEYIEKTLEQGKLLGASQSELWFETGKELAMPTVSPNGTQLALIVKDKEAGHSLCVYQTGENEKARQEFVEANKKLLERDPLDVPDTMPPVFPREQKACLSPVSFQWMQNPRWQNESQLFFTALTQGADGKAQFDLYRWDIDTDQVAQLSQGLGIQRFDVSENGQFAVIAVSQQGGSQLLRLELATGELLALTPKSLAHYYDFPRLHPAKQQLAYLSQALNQKWRLNLLDLESLKESQLALPKGYQYLSFPEWSRDGSSLMFVASKHNRLHLYQYQLESSKLIALSSGKQSLFWPTPLGEKSWLHLAPGQKESALYRLDLDKVKAVEVVNLTASAEAELQGVPALNPVRAKTEAGEGRIFDYGLGEQKGSLTFAASLNSATSHLAEFGYHSADLLQRMNWKLNMSVGQSLKGGSFVWSWNPWAVDFQVRGYHFKSDSTESLTTKESGVSLQASTLAWQSTHHVLGLEAHFHWQELEQVEQKVARFSLHPKGEWLWPSWKVTYQAQIAWLQGFGDALDWQGEDADLTLTLWMPDSTQYGAVMGWKKRDLEGANLLRLGGFRSNLMTDKSNPNRILIPELALDSLTGDEYRGTKLFAGKDGAQVYYQNLQLDELERIKSLGFSFNQSIELGLSLLQGMTLEAGLARTKQGNRSQTEFWLGFYQPW